MSQDQVDPRGIWRRAYELLKQEDEALVQEYEEKIQSAKDQVKLNGKDRLSPGIYPEELHAMLSLTDDLIRQEEHKHEWKQKATTGVQVVTSMKDIVAQAIKSSPEASLAWAGLCLILPRSDNVEGLSKVIHRISYYPPYAVWLMNHRCPGPDEAWDVLEVPLSLLLRRIDDKEIETALERYLEMGTMDHNDRRHAEAGNGNPREGKRPQSHCLAQSSSELDGDLPATIRVEQSYEAVPRRNKRCSCLNISKPRHPTKRNKGTLYTTWSLGALQQGQEELCRPGGFKQSTLMALCGLGGAGKSRIALEYVYRMREQDSGLCIFWVYAASKSSLQSSYKTIHREIPRGYLRMQPQSHTGAGSNVDTETETFLLVNQWLRSDQIGRWLLVVDNADDLTFVDATRPEESHLMNLIPSASNGKVLITSRNERVAEELVGLSNRVVRVDRMTMTEALSLFRSMLPDDPSPEADIENLAEALMCLPLAIKQACAYIRATYTTVTEYLHLFMANEINQKSLLEENFGDITRRTDVPNAVILTWQMSFEKMKQQVPVTDASDILAFMAMIGREEIPRFILACRCRKGEIALQRDIGTLISYSLITPVSQKNTHFSMHRLIQLTVRAWLEKRGELDIFEAAALEVIHDLFRKALSEEDWPRCRLLYHHAQTVSQYEYNDERYQEMKKELLEDVYSYSHPGPARMDPYQDLAGKIPTQLSGSQSSILQSREFLRWVRGEERGLLILGKPGTGKTNLCTFLITRYLPEHINAEILHFLFTFSVTKHDQMGPWVLLKLLAQLCLVYVEGSRIPDKVREIWSRHKDPSAEQPNIEELVSVLVHVADDLDRNVIVVLDGLDEIHSMNSVDDILRTIDFLLDHSRIRVLASSRGTDYTEKLQWSQRMLTTELPLETDATMRDFISQRLCFAAIGWTTVIPHMIQQESYDQIISIIKSNPAGSIARLYDAVFASKPNAINSDLNTSFDESDLTAICHPLAGLTFIGGERVIQFTHSSVKSHVLEVNTSPVTGEAEAHWTIISSCLRCILRYGPAVGNTDIIDELPSQLLMYAAEYWPKHWRLCLPLSGTVREMDIPEEVREYMRQLFDPTSSQAFLGWLRIFDPLNPDRGHQMDRSLKDFPPQATYIAHLGLPSEILMSTPPDSAAIAQPNVPNQRRMAWKKKARAFWARRH
ncbi:hypothetical protein ASPBRDRAFT_135541 [Aspergillus brasiliensis CBS 101740]|uniref:NACHT domain-containing protein n=1 Tax=Aspergillus brasiliensis (strain CBS 101740 / IMI 381727 / IBT 21946) TaxID=767769 RepID=A0A1L9U7M1_ASPBC|nr:hypothetical protein ASPBRDRAFT_135541 [Aspergillus brasiliensis CBS 101740]